MKVMKKILIAVSAVVILACAGYALWFSANPAPEVSFTTLSGQRLSLASLKGKVVLVNFWATSCPGCVEEMPQIKRMYQQYSGQGLAVLAVAMSYDPPNYVASFVSNNRLPFMVAHDTQGSIAHAFGDIQLTPTTFLIDKQGRILKSYVGVMDFKEVNQLIENGLRA